MSEQPESAPQHMVLEIAWTEGSVPRTEIFGPWQGTDDFAHQSDMIAFLHDWRRVTGCEPERVVMAIVLDPREWLKQEEARRADQ